MYTYSGRMKCEVNENEWIIYLSTQILQEL